MHVDKYDSQLNNLLQLSPEYIRRFCSEKTELADPTKIAYIKDYDVFVNWLYNNRLIPSNEMAFFDISMLNMLKVDDLEQYVLFLINERKKSYYRKVYSLRSILSFLLFTKDDRGNYLLIHNDFLKVLKVENDRNSFVRKHEVDETKENLQHFVDFVYQGYSPKNSHDALFYTTNRLRDTAIIALIADTGLRISEIKNLNLNNVNLSKKTVSIIRRKRRARGSYFVEIQFGSYAERIIREYLSTEPDRSKGNDLPFFQTKGANSYGNRFTRRALEMLIKKYANAYGKSEITANRLRQSFIIDYLSKNKISDGEVQLGLSITDMIGIYTKYNDYGV